MKYTDKTEITKAEFLQLTGLLVLAKRHNAALKEILAAVVEITGEKDENGHGADGVYSDYSAEGLLDRLGITVSANA